LFSIYWPDYDGKIYLNTEYKGFTYGNLNIIPVKGCAVKKDAHKITWSECLKRALEVIDTEIILYMQEDYFLRNYVKDATITHFAHLVRDNDIDCLHLTDQGARAESRSLEFEKLYIVPRKNKDRISCQAAFWRKDVLKQYIRTYETAWNFETYGSKRAAILKHNFYVVDMNWVKKNQYELLPYVFTGVIGGKWLKEVIPLFKEHNITIDFSKRGFYAPVSRISFTQRLIARVYRLPSDIRNYLDLIKLAIIRS
jgi:hypothetical protein